MTNNFELVANVGIAITQATTGVSGTDRILLVGSPTSPSAAVKTLVKKYATLDEMKTDGYTDNEPLYCAASVAFAQSPAPAFLYVACIGEEETIASAITRAIDAADWYVVVPVGVAVEDVLAAATCIESTEKFMVAQAYGEVANYQSITSQSFNRSLLINFGYSNVTTDPALGYYGAAAGFAAVWMNLTPGSETTAFKTIKGISATAVSKTLANTYDAQNISYYSTIGNRACTFGGKTVSGEWADVIRFRDWLKLDIQARLVKLFLDNPKIPFTDAGIALVHNTILASLKSGVAAGGIAEDSYDENGKAVYGYTIHCPAVAEISEVDKRNRVFSGIRFNALLNGAIHIANLSGELTYKA